MVRVPVALKMDLAVHIISAVLEKEIWK